MRVQLQAICEFVMGTMPVKLLINFPFMVTYYRDIREKGRKIWEKIWEKTWGEIQRAMTPTSWNYESMRKMNLEKTSRKGKKQDMWLGVKTQNEIWSCSDDGIKESLKKKNQRALHLFILTMIPLWELLKPWPTCMKF